MNKPSYEDLQRKVRELEQIVNIKTYPRDIYFETKDLLCFRLNKEWQFDSFEEKILELTGYEERDLLLISLLDIVHPEDRNILQGATRTALHSDRYFQVEVRIVTKQGQTKWVKMRGPLFCDEEGRFHSLQGVMNDITAEKNTELALESEREIFVWVANNLEDGIYIVSDDYRITFMNKALIHLVGDHVGEVCYQALFDRDTVCPWSVMEAIQHESCGFQEYHLPKMGRTFQVRSFPIKGLDGSIGKLGQLKDITQTKKLEYEVQEYEARHQAIVDAANMADLGILILQDHEGIDARFRYVNQAFCRITGFSVKELLNKSLADLIHPDDLNEAMRHYRNRQRGEIINHAYELKFLRKDGTPITVFFSVAISSYESKTATIGFMRDITKRKKFEKSLWLSQRLASIGKLAAEIAHEINNPLTSVLTFNKLVDRIIRKEPFPLYRLSELKDYVRFLDAEASRCATIARNLLDFSRHGEIELKENDVHEILEKTLDILRHRAQMNEIEVIALYDRDIPHVFCDFKRLQQAFVNIFWNAIEAMPDGGTLQVFTELNREENRVDITICDTGIGISEEDLECVFEPFFTTKAEGKGVGLGLSVAYGIIRQHQGQIQVYSEKGEGTTFIVQLQADISGLETGNRSI